MSWWERLIGRGRKDEPPAYGYDFVDATGAQGTVFPPLGEDATPEQQAQRFEAMAEAMPESADQFLRLAQRARDKADE